MNERMKDLAAQAFFETDYDDAQNLPETMERFAELIIAECCVALHPMLRDMISRTQGVDMIVEHFKGE